MADGNPASLTVEERDAARLFAITATLTALIDELGRFSPDIRPAVRSKAATIIQMASARDNTNGAIPKLLNDTIDQLFGGVPDKI